MNGERAPASEALAAPAVSDTTPKPWELPAGACFHTKRPCEPGCRRRGLCQWSENKIRNQQRFIDDARERVKHHDQG
jgi:hypothetical protein